MKRIFICIALLLTLSISFNVSAMECSICGVNLKWLKERDWEKVTLGVVTSLAVHVAGHLLYLEWQGKAWHMEGRAEICDDCLTPNEARWFGRAGFVAQVGTALVLSLIMEDSDFTRGFCAATTASAVAYPFRHDTSEGPGDFHLIDKYGGDWKAEYALYSVGSIASLALSMRNFDPQEPRESLSVRDQQ